MKLCRFSLSEGLSGRLGLVLGDLVHDVTLALGDDLVAAWPLPRGDMLIGALPRLRAKIEGMAAHSQTHPLEKVLLQSPIANPGKIVGAPVNYREHAHEAAEDQEIAHGRRIEGPEKWGLFLKAPSALSGPESNLALRFPHRRTDHEVELVAVIGKRCSCIQVHEVPEYVAGYVLGLDVTLRGPEFPSFRKSIDGYAVLGPWLTTADEIADVGDIDLSLSVNGVLRQSGLACEMIMSPAELIAFASSFYTLEPGDLIYTGTPAGVGPIFPGDILKVSSNILGGYEVKAIAYGSVGLAPGIQP